MRPGSSLVSGAIVAAFLVVACSTAGTSPSTPGGMAARMAWHEGEPTPDGCLVATMDEVSSASGFQIVRTLSRQAYEPGCLYFDADGQVLATGFQARETSASSFAIEAARPDHVDVSGVGDQAIWIPRLWALWAWQGDMLVSIGIGQIGETRARLELAKKLGPMIVDRFR